MKKSDNTTCLLQNWFFWIPRVARGLLRLSYGVKIGVAHDISNGDWIVFAMKGRFRASRNSWQRRAGQADKKCTNKVLIPIHNSHNPGTAVELL
jgi:hypothetical protein